MEKEDVTLLAQLLHTMKEVVNAMEKYERKEDYEKMNSAKKELLNLQKKVTQLVR